MTLGSFVRHRPRRVPRPGAVSTGSVLLALACATALPSCTPPQLLTLRSGLDSLRAVVDSSSARNAADLAALRRDVAEQKDLILTSGASSGTTIKELVDQMGTLEGKLDDARESLGAFRKRYPRADVPEDLRALDE